MEASPRRVRHVSPRGFFRDAGVTNVFVNIDLLSVGIAVASTAVFGFIVFFNNRTSVTNRAFLLFAAATILWGIFNYLSYHVTSTLVAFWLLRLTLFFGTVQAFTIFHLLYVFPQQELRLKKWYTHALIPLTIVTALLTMTPLVLREVIRIFPDGRIAEAENGPGIFLFGALNVGLVVSGLALLMKKIIRAEGATKKQFGLVLIGALAMFSLIIIFNFVFPAFYGNTRFIPLGALFMFPFIISTGYAIIRHGLFDVRVVATEILTLIVIIVTFFEILTSEGFMETVMRVGIFGVLLVFGIFLIRSVRREALQRERLEMLTKELGIANEELKRLDRAKSEFLSLASHQLRAPLTVIKGYVSLAIEGTLGPLSEKTKESLEKVFFSTGQLVKLVSDLLDLSRIESGRIQYQKVPADLTALVNRIIEEMRPRAEAKKLALRFENKIGVPCTFIFDPDKIREIVINLVDNALKYSDHGSIFVQQEYRESPQGRMVRLMVRDEGLGIKRDDIPGLFTKFTRTEEARLSDPSGLGIGLYFVKRVVEDHGGKAWVESGGIGRGSTFFIELPCVR